MITIGENQLFVQDSGGDKPALLFVHGIMMDHSVWKHQVAEFANDYRVVCVDLRGYGESAATSPDISFEDHVSDLVGLVDALGLKDVTLIGWSMGGAIAQVMGVTQGHNIKRFVMVDSTPQLLASDAFSHALPPEAAQQLGGVLVENFSEGCGAFCGLVAPESEAIAAELTTIATATDQTVALMAFQSAGGRNQLDLLSRITTETHVIAGADDQVCPADASHYLAEHIAGCTTVANLIEGAGHAPFLTQPDAFNAALSKTLG